ncbi:MAG: trypsin-like peptidase domain-containing protein, partial [Planctomycetes bacterium]|nr:trypsin-like peptidase domain-containing protein [Planctomycetota bacterium]
MNSRLFHRLGLVVCSLLSTATLAASSPPHPTSFDRAIDVLLARTVKLYGLKVGGEAGYGTGIIVSEDGLVLTVSSLLIDAHKVRAVTEDGTRYLAEVLHRDPQRQLALLRLRPFEEDHGEAAVGTSRVAKVGPFPFFNVDGDASNPQSTRIGAEGSTLQPGDWVVAAGNAFKVAEGAEPMSIVHGIYSARTRLDARRTVKEFPYHGDVLVIDAVTSNPGAPGSAVVDLDGEFVGMIGRLVISNLTHTHFNYALPRDVLAAYFKEATTKQDDKLVATVKTDGDAHAAANANSNSAATTDELASASSHSSQTKSTVDLGIRVVRSGYQNVPPIVDRVRRASPADVTGVRKDDLILSING